MAVEDTEQFKAWDEALRLTRSRLRLVGEGRGSFGESTE
jgi:hypothetical protein